jgi:hypothetical protein
VEVVSLSKLSFFRQWVAQVCQAGSKRWTVRRKKTPDPFDRREVKPMPKLLPYGVKVKFCVASAAEISLSNDWVR